MTMVSVCTADFINNVYTLGGAPAVFSDLFTAAPYTPTPNPPDQDWYSWVDPPNSDLEPTGLMINNVSGYVGTGSSTISTAGLNTLLNNIVAPNQFYIKVIWNDGFGTNLALSNELFFLGATTDSLNPNGDFVSTGPDSAGSVSKWSIPSTISPPAFLYGPDDDDPHTYTLIAQAVMDNGAVQIDFSPGTGSGTYPNGAPIATPVAFNIGPNTGSGNGTVGFAIQYLEIAYSLPPSPPVPDSGGRSTTRPAPPVNPMSLLNFGPPWSNVIAPVGLETIGQEADKWCAPN